MSETPEKELRRGWTTGACAAAATTAALMALWGEGFPREVSIVLPKGEIPVFPLALAERGDGWARAGITKDAGDDPDVTHGALIIVRVSASDGGIVFRAGDGVGMVTKPGLPIAVGEPAINPVPREMMSAVVAEMARSTGQTPDVTIEISVPGGAALALRHGTRASGSKVACRSWAPRVWCAPSVARRGSPRSIAGSMWRVRMV